MSILHQQQQRIIPTLFQCFAFFLHQKDQQEITNTSSNQPKSFTSQANFSFFFLFCITLTLEISDLNQLNICP